MKHILTVLTVLLFAPLAALPAETKSAGTKAPFRVLYSNDTTNTMVCVSPYHQGQAARTASATRRQTVRQLPFTRR